MSGIWDQILGASSAPSAPALGPDHEATCSSASGGKIERISWSPVWWRRTPGIAQIFAKSRGWSEYTARSRPSNHSILPYRPGISGKPWRSVETPYRNGLTVRAMKAGAVGFLTKPFRDQDLLDAIQQALERDRKAREQRTEVDKLRARYRLLTPRERGVMALVVTGLNKQVAAELGTSEASVQVHRQHVMEKMQAGSLAALVRMADTVGVSSPKP